MQTGKANYRLAARLRGNELLLDADLRKAVEEEHLRAVRRAEGLKCCADRRAFAESVEWERLGDFFLRIGSHPSAVRAAFSRGYPSRNSGSSASMARSRASPAQQAVAVSAIRRKRSRRNRQGSISVPWS